MSIARAVAHGTTRLLSGLLLAKGLDFALYLVLARRLGVEEFGRYTYAFSFTLLFTIVADLGVTTVFTREAARAPGRTRTLLGDALAVKLALAAVTLAGTIGVSVATGSPARSTVLIAVFTLAMLVNSAATLFEQILKAAGRAGTAGLSVLAQSTTAFACGLALVALGFGALGGALAYLAAALAHLAAAGAASRALWRVPADLTDGSTPLARRAALVREAAPLAISGVFIALYFRVDSVLLHVFRTEREVGLYGSIYRFFEAFVLLSAAYRSVLFPIMARAADGPVEALSVLCRKSLRLHLVFTVGVAVFFSFEARAIVSFVLGPAYRDAAPGLAILVWALPGAFMADTMLHLLAARRRQHLGARAALATAIFNVVLNLLLIPRFSFLGAAAATALSEALCFALLLAAFQIDAPDVGLARAAAPPLLAGALLAGVLGLVAKVIPATALGLAITAVLAVASYAAAAFVTGAVGRQELQVARSLVPGRASGRS